MTTAQNALYWRQWAALHRADPAADRHATHASLGLPESHLAFTNPDLDRWIAHCTAAARPADYTAQIRQQQQPETRLRYCCDLLLSALEKPDSYAEGIVRRQNAGTFLSYRQMPESALGDVRLALHRLCRTRWKSVAALRLEITHLTTTLDLDERAAREAACRALACETLPPLEKIPFERLSLLLGALRHLGKIIPVAPAAPAGNLTHPEDPF